MSEYQNKAVELMHMRIGRDSSMNPEERRDAFVRRAIQLYYAMGGEVAGLQESISTIYAQNPPRVDTAVGDVMFALAGAGHAADLDIIQAAYNKLDQAMPATSPVRRART